jgi:multidrug efflux system outer membrane protein
MRSDRPTVRATLLAASLAVLGGCAVGPTYQAPQVAGSSAWQAPQPAGAKAVNLVDWWGQFDDPVMAELVQAALATHPSLARAQARIAQARAQAGVDRSAQFPGLVGNVGEQREAMWHGGAQNLNTRNLDARWELDLFGGRAAANEASRARWAASEADEQAARVSLAAEVADTVVDVRACRLVVAIFEQDVRSHGLTTDLTRLKMKAGFSSTSDAALSDAATADARQRMQAQRARCDLDVKALVALTDVPEPTLRARLAARDSLPQPATIVVDAVPAHALSQRPDVVAAERRLRAASADINVAEAARYPSLSLEGTIGRIESSGSGAVFSGWSLLGGLTAPLLDAGGRRAGADAARARYDEALADWQQTVRDAVRETEEALVRLDDTGKREDDIAASARDYASFVGASDDRYRAGPGNLFDVEQARRTALGARVNLITVQRDRVVAWIALYKTLGGGWSPDAPARVAQSGSR